MRDDARVDVVKVWAYAVVSLALGAALTPWVYNCGMALAEVTAGKQTNGVVETVAGWCRRGGMGWYFKVSWTMAAAVLCVPTVAWLGLGPRRSRRQQPWSVRLPDGGRHDGGQALAMRWDGWRDGAKGAVVAVTLVALLGWALVRAGAFGWRGWGPGVIGEALWLLPMMLLWAVMHEVLFRGAALGVFLRAVRVPAAILLAALLYALVGFMVPPDDMTVADPESRLAGFVVLATRCRDLADPWIAAAGVLPWLAFGCVLGFARWRTRALWLPVGLHAGWVFGNGVFLLLVVPLNQPDPIARVLVGESLRQGLIPVAVVALAGMVLHFMTPVPDAGYDTH